MLLRDRVKMQELMLREYHDQISLLTSYLRSSKFSEDTTVQTSDVLLRITEMVDAVYLIECESS